MKTVPLYRFLAPRFWLIWLVVGLLRVSTALPLRLQLAVGRPLGRAAGRWLRVRHNNAARNIALCLPELGEPDRERILRGHFESLGCALFETAMAWWGSDRRLRRLARPEGLEHIHEALRRGQGVLLLASHFTTLEIGTRLLSLFVAGDAVYQRFSNPLVEEMLRRRRSRYSGMLIPNTKPLALVRRLKSNRVVWYAPDQTYPPKHRILAPFFSIPAMTNTTVARIVSLSKAVVLPFFTARMPDGSYRLVIDPPLAHFPSGDELTDATRLNVLIEQQIREAPEQYLWIHRRFRAYDDDYPDYYRA